MAWIQIRINANADNAEMISDLLMDTGSASVTYVDAKDTPIYEPKLGTVQLWADTTVIGLYDANHDMDSVVAVLKAEPTLADKLVYKIEQLEDKDWEREWMDNFHPIKFGERLWICPSWRDIPEPDAVNVLLDPGLAFGTGTHATTALCLKWLESQDLTGKTVVDFGCGSGILGIAAIKLGAERMIGIDIDPQAIEASRDNAERNGVADKLEVYLPEDQPDFSADVVVANILAQPLKELHEVILGLLKPNGKIAMSGILEEQAQSVADVYAPFLALDEIAVEGEWTRVSGTKKS
ncbi:MULTISPECIES: 50S ribosomal protein L11 methyltransferase [Pseudoalteromonas]|jgi:ribosomal protein L11 methyltransferase|uniref:Ribosomal protein L11 methyltransferase n=1 Tax=Pseudoalteromonas lipolytica TaxID=570156 RepID=A0AAD0WBS4_9GAMM|nr:MULTISPECIES: 50S ribosomal protein L11 methyltransferase [Pseudoalteromonas]AXV64326.1 50S ribosomal protein L11 methyltransferase [Pseudoalteromonas donghaensis]EWH06467.1 ribosomal protein L11 methyltransferase [Pseudoalteromonas lipolytica SCSIO 04301]MAE02390.1 50S ribosomal protein L11 methyltransferase [Pseudoalteromonas sp.]MBE0352002.1 ribosomal protein L11 methyltransferase [Pseudoalteromonas lipolytica LMEB 39]MCC9661045.1 50S ribosomal protein L11 methyltransferase [Pseudoaltero|tara:strand:- start:208 stop:1089 length:882 start_codon:yes stop_codon:yes gene_type:complete